jgi:hypothetical protein
LIIVGEVVALRDKLNWFQPAAASAELALLRTDSARPAGDDSGDA